MAELLLPLLPPPPPPPRSASRHVLFAVLYRRSDGSQVGRHYCRLSDGNNVSEPNNIVRPPESCNLANYSQSLGNETVKTWGWTDNNCESEKYPFMCRVASEWRCWRQLLRAYSCMLDAMSSPLPPAGPCDSMRCAQPGC